LGDESFKDLTLKVKNGSFRVHKLVVAAHSPLIAEILKDYPEIDSLNFDDFGFDDFKSVMEHVYGEREGEKSSSSLSPKPSSSLKSSSSLKLSSISFPSSSSSPSLKPSLSSKSSLKQSSSSSKPSSSSSLKPHSNHVETLKIAGKLKMQHLVNATAQKLKDQVKPENSFEILVLANKYELEELRLAAFEEFRKNFPSKKLKPELAGQVEKLRKLVEIKRLMDEIVDDDDSDDDDDDEDDLGGGRSEIEGKEVK
jgi:hypothetical protein